MRNLNKTWKVGAKVILFIGVILFILLLLLSIHANKHLLRNDPIGVTLDSFAFAGATPLAIAFYVFRDASNAGNFFIAFAITIFSIIVHIYYTMISGHSDYSNIFSIVELLLGLFMTLIYFRGKMKHA